MWDDRDSDDGPLLEPDDGAPICSGCGVTMLPDGNGDFACDNPDCEAYGESI